MSKWEDSFNKKTISNNHCYCTDDRGLFVPNRQLSVAIAGLLFLFFSCFIVGYFLGKRSSVEQFTQKMCQESFSDQIYTSVIAANDFNNGESQAIAEVGLANSIDTENNIVAESAYLPDNEELHADSAHKSVKESSSVLLESATNENNAQFYAQLIGFGTEKAAQKFVEKLALRNIETLVKKRISKTAKGRTIYWYQVVTLPYDNKETLTALVNRLAKEERLSGIYIGSC